MNMKNKKGFTLVETMVAITILTLAISGAFMTANSAIVAAEVARDQLTASYMAQEGIEYVRLMRDNDYLAAYKSNTATASSVGWNNFLSSLPITDSSPFTSFTRTIQATPATATLPNTDEKIILTVSWNFHNATYSVTITDHLTPWQ